MKISGFGIAGHIVELQRHEAGLPTGTVLTSVASGLSWEVRARILFDHATAHHTYFGNEVVEFALLRFSSPESLAASLQDITEAEHRKLYRYLIQPREHDQKPQHGEELAVQLPMNNKVLPFVRTNMSSLLV